MTLLAPELAQDAGVGLMTDLPSRDRLASVARRDCSPLGLSAFRDPDPHWLAAQLSDPEFRKRLAERNI